VRWKFVDWPTYVKVTDGLPQFELEMIREAIGVVNALAKIAPDSPEFLEALDFLHAEGVVVIEGQEHDSPAFTG